MPHSRQPPLVNSLMTYSIVTRSV